ncbi:MAG: SDR family oxidoreductase, partial [Candidatus Marinimicrobia bacterium]|nr:SDR family oxidoreductase [Candidatus Neomarinimicrobiota bacterium]
MGKILLTGASGFLGSNIVQTLQKSKKVICGYKNFKPPEKNCVKTDLANLSQLKSTLDAIQPNIIIHTAAISRPKQCLQNPELSKLVNIESTGIIADWCKHNQARLIFTSTDMVYSGENPSYTEKDQTRPVNIYGQQKVQDEQLIAEKCENFAILRLALMYGRGFYQRDYASQWLERDLKIKMQEDDPEPVGLYTDQIRSMISVKNVAKIIKELAHSNHQGIFNIGGRQPISRYEFGRELIKVLAISDRLIKPVKYQNLEPDVQAPLDVSLDIDKALKSFTT